MLSIVWLVAAGLCLAAAVGVFVIVFQNKMNFFRGVFLAAGCFLIAFLLVVQAQPAEYSIHATVNRFFDQVRDGALAIPMESWQQALPDGADAQQTISNFLFELEQARKLYFLLFPASIMLTMLLLSYVLMMIVKNMLALIWRSGPIHPLFSELALPRGVFWAFLVSMAGGWWTSGVVSDVFTNMTALIYAVAMVCGLSVIDFFVRRRVSFAFVRLLIYALIGTVLGGASSFLLYALALVALIDSHRDIRRLRMETGGRN